MRMILCLAVIIAVPLISGPTHAAVVNFDVSGGTGWQDTGVNVSAGEVVKIAASGSITFDSAGRRADPDGSPDGDLGIGSLSELVPAAPSHTLVGRIGNTASLGDLSGFLIGSNFERRAPQSGKLFLGFNDGFVQQDRTGLDSGGVGDNSGSFQVVIEILPSAPNVPPLIPQPFTAEPDPPPLLSQLVKLGVSALLKFGAQLPKIILAPFSLVFGFLTADELLLVGTPCDTIDSTTGQPPPECLSDADVYYSTQSSASFSMLLPRDADFVGMVFDFLPLNLEATDRVFTTIDDEVIFNVPGSVLQNGVWHHTLFLEFPNGSGARTVKMGLTSESAGRRMIVSKIGFVTLPRVASVRPAKLWVGLKNSDDQGTNFDLRMELYKNGTLLASGETRCIRGVTRNPDKAKEVSVPFGPISDGAVASDDVLSLRALARIGTNANGTKCGGHSNAVGLRLYYDATHRPSGFGAELTPDPLKDFFLHSGGSDFLDDIPPTTPPTKKFKGKFKDSGGLNFKNGNLWREIGTWGMTLP